MLVNQTGASIYYAGYEQEIAALIDWAPSSREENRIHAGAAKAIKFAEIYALAPGKNFILYWWTNDRHHVAHFSSVLVTPEKLTGFSH